MRSYEYREGCQAYYQHGLASEDNPYQGVDTDKMFDWFDGYFTSMDEDCDVHY